MTSEERREARYRRRQDKRKAKKKRKVGWCDDFDTVFSYKNLYESYKRCRLGVAWKSSTQKYITQAPLLVYQTWKALQEGKFRSKGFYEFDINERGKKRHIRSVTMGERVVQRCLCDNALVPMLGRTFIYDNGASMERKGYHFSIKRLCQHLREHYRKHGATGYILLFDFKKFFDRVSHKVCKLILGKEFSDSRIIGLTEHFIDMFGDIGLGLGSQISQTFALASANRLDHYIKEMCRIRGYGRYMDDGYIIHESKAFLKEYLDGIRYICSKLGITLNEEKTQIVKLSHGFTYLKTRFFLLKTGRVLKKIPRMSVTRERRKLKKLALFVECGRMSYKDAYASWQSWDSYASNFSAWRTRCKMKELFNKLFIFEWVDHGMPMVATL